MIHSFATILNVFFHTELYDTYLEAGTGAGALFTNLGFFPRPLTPNFDITETGVFVKN